jgi:hypothetical protein
MLTQFPSTKIRLFEVQLSIQRIKGMPHPVYEFSLGCFARRRAAGCGGGVPRKLNQTNQIFELNQIKPNQIISNV